MTRKSRRRPFQVRTRRRSLHTIAGDGSLRADATGRDFISFYLPGEPSVLGAGLFQLSGHVTEWYAPDGSYLGNAFSGTAVNLCNAVGA